MPDTFLDAEFLDGADARVSAFDAGMQHGVGLFETMHGVGTPDGPSVFRIEQHTARLARSARDLGLSESVREDALADAVLETLRRSGHADEPGARVRVRLTVTGGDLNLLHAGSPAHRPTVLIHAQPATAYPDEMFARGVSMVVADLRVNPLDPTQGHKTLSYWSRLRELQSAARKGAGEALVFQVSNHIAGGCVSNLFVARDGALHTPIARTEEQEVADGKTTLPSPVLPGVTRSWVIENSGLTCERRMLSIDDVLDADEAFLTNSSWGVLPVVRIEKEEIGGAEPGPIAVGLRERWLDATANHNGHK